MTKDIPPAAPPARALLAALATAWLALALPGCATTGAGDAAAPEIPEGATEATRTEPNGDVITEYRVGTQLRVVKVVPARGPTYYLYDRDGDGTIDNDYGNLPTTWFKLFEW